MLAGAASTAVTLSVRRRLDRADVSLPGWTRTNYRGAPVSLAGGVAAAIGSVVVAGATAPSGRRLRYLTAGAAAALAGGYDDLLAPRWERPADKGVRGHVQALRQGRPSGGVVKAALIGAGALVATGQRRPNTSGFARALDAALVASAANLVNLFDVRPGRAAKVVVLVACTQVSGPGRATAAGALGAAAAVLPADLAERHLLGDTGANSLGAVLGLAVTAAGIRRRLGALAAILALTAASERVSFSTVIASVPVLRALDEWGRLGVLGPWAR